jgi:ribosome-associated protein
MPLIQSIDSALEKNVGPHGAGEAALAQCRKMSSVLFCPGFLLARERTEFVTASGKHMPRITDTITVDESELSESFVRASGPGGQNVNKVSSAVQLRFDARRSPSLPNDVAVRLLRLAGRRATKEGVIVIVAQAHRDQTRNRAEARERLFDLIRQAAVRPKPRRPTKVPKAQKRERLEAKKHRAGIKAMRHGKGWD